MDLKNRFLMDLMVLIVFENGLFQVTAVGMPSNIYWQWAPTFMPVMMEDW